MLELSSCVETKAAILFENLAPLESSEKHLLYFP